MNAIVKYPGAKWSLADWVISHFPEHHSYLEPFFGSGAVLFTKTRSDIETVNGLDGDVVNLFDWIRKDPERLARAIYWTPYACPDYDLYPEFTRDTAYGFLTRGCPNNCPFCIVSGKEGRESYKVADLSEWWSGQKNIVLMDPNLLACRDHMELLGQLASSGAWVDIDQGLDARLLTPKNIDAIKQIKIKEIHFAWDLMKNSERVIEGLHLWKRYGKKNRHGNWGTVYVLTNYNTTMGENLYRIYTLRDMGYDPYVMIYDKPNAPREIRLLQRWCNNRLIFRSEPDFKKYDPKRG